MIKKNQSISLKPAIFNIALLFSFYSSCSLSGAVNSKGGFIDFNIYPYLSDVDSDNTVTVNIFSKMDHGLSYFSLTNFSNQAGDSELKDTSSFYTEQNLRWSFSNELPLDLTAQFNFRGGNDNDRHRLGVRWRVSDTEAMENFFNFIGLNYSINWHAYQFDDVSEDVWQIEHVFRLVMPSVSKKLYLSGFVDHTFDEDLPSEVPDDPIVAEVQLGYEIIDNLYVITEYRINQYRREDVNNLSVGIEYVIRW